MKLSQAQIAYLEALAAGAGIAALDAAYQTLVIAGNQIVWAQVGAAALLGGLAYLTTALRYLNLPNPTAPTTTVTTTTPSTIPAEPVVTSTVVTPPK
jgi:hypothetical protein